MMIHVIIILFVIYLFFLNVYYICKISVLCLFILFYLHTIVKFCQLLLSTNDPLCHCFKATQLFIEKLFENKPNNSLLSSTPKLAFDFSLHCINMLLWFCSVIYDNHMIGQPVIVWHVGYAAGIFLSTHLIKDL